MPTHPALPEHTITQQGGEAVRAVTMPNGLTMFEYGPDTPATQEGMNSASYVGPYAQPPNGYYPPHPQGNVYQQPQ